MFNVQLKFSINCSLNSGFVTTARVTHATPAALYAYSADREWECNKRFKNGSLDSTDIAWQLIHTDPGRRAKVILGGGRSAFLPLTPTNETSR
jgi:alkaline phosphatase